MKWQVKEGNNEELAAFKCRWKVTLLSHPIIHHTLAYLHHTAIAIFVGIKKNLNP